MLVVAVLSLGPWDAPSQAAPNSNIRVKDLAGRQVTIPSVPKRIVCLGPGALRLIVYLGAADLVVGVENMEKRFSSSRPYWIAHPELHKLPTVSPGGAGAINKLPDLEAILRVHPDVIFISYMDKTNADILQKKLEIPVIVLTYGAVGSFDEKVYESMHVIGKILGKSHRAKSIQNYIEESRRDLLRRVRGIPRAKKPRVYVGGIGFKGSHGMDSTETNYSPFVWTGSKNVAQGKTADGHLMVGKEQLLAWDPQVIFLDALGMELFKQDYGKNRSFYSGLKAFETKRVYILYPFNWYSTNIGTVICDAYAVGKILYPMEFSDVDVKEKANEVYEFLLGRSVYEQMSQMYGTLGSPLTSIR